MNLTSCRALLAAAAFFVALPVHAQQQAAAAPQQAQAEPVSARGWRRSFRPSIAAAATMQAAPSSFASSRKPPRTSRPKSTGSRPRRSARAARKQLPRSVQRAIGAVRPDEQQDPADARQPRPHPGRHRTPARRRPAPERASQRRAILVALTQNNCGAQYQQQVAATPPPRAAGLFEVAVRAEVDLHARRAMACPASTRAERHLPHRLRAHLRRLLLSDLLRHHAGALCRRREDLPRLLPRRRGAALFASQSRRGHEPGGVGLDAAALHGAAECVPLSHRARPGAAPASGRARPGRRR